MQRFISPNVNYINNGALTWDNHAFQNVATIRTSSRLFQGGVINVDCNSPVAPVSDILALFNIYDKAGYLYPVGRSGLKDEKDVGSHRFCTMNDAFANAIDQVLHNSNALAHALDYLNSDNESFVFKKTSPYFRFMRYQQGGMHYPHYDTDYELPDESVTRYSMVMYFSENFSGELCFVNDETEHAVDRSDWNVQATDEQCWLKVAPSIGRIVLFPHELCHSVLELDVNDNWRYVVRGDLEFYKYKKETKEVIL